MNAEGRPNVGDRVRVTYEGEVETVGGKGLRIDGLWHYFLSSVARRAPQIEVIEPALQVGWHRTVAPHAIVGVAAVVARHWDGHQWGGSETSHPTVRSAFRSIEFLGGGCDE